MSETKMLWQGLTEEQATRILQNLKEGTERECQKAVGAWIEAARRAVDLKVDPPAHSEAYQRMGHWDTRATLVNNGQINMLKEEVARAAAHYAKIAENLTARGKNAADQYALARQHMAEYEALADEAYRYFHPVDDWRVAEDDED